MPIDVDQKLKGPLKSKAISMVDVGHIDTPASESNVEIDVKQEDLKALAKKNMLDNLEQRSNVLYIRLKRRFDTISDAEKHALSMHPNIISVSFPRRGEKERFFHAKFASKEVAFAAMKKLRKRGDCYVAPPKNPLVINKKVAKMNKKTKQKTSEDVKEKLRNLWN